MKNWEWSPGGTANEKYFARAGTAMALLLLATPLHGLTSFSRIPDLDYPSSMSWFIGGVDDVLVVPQLEEGTIWQLAYDGWEWNLVAEYDPLDWTQTSRINPRWTFPAGNEVLFLDRDPSRTDFFVPQLTIVEKVEGTYSVQDRVSLSGLLEDPTYFDFSINGVVALEDLVVITGQVGVVGVGPVLGIYIFQRTEAGWIVGPKLDIETGYWWALFTEQTQEQFTVWVLEMTGSYFDNPWPYALKEYTLETGAWVEQSQFTFELDQIWAASNQARALVSPDGQSVLIYGSEGLSAPPIELRRTDGSWSFIGPVNGGGLDFTNLFFQQPGDGFALMRRGDIPPDPPEPQHYHILQYSDGQWELSGDLTSGTILSYYYENEVFHVLGNDRLTLFEIQPYDRSVRRASSYSLPDLTPILVPWFRDSLVMDGGTEYLPGFGIFQSFIADGGNSIWAWNWNLGWLLVAGRDSDMFWFWSPVVHWALFDAEYFNMEGGPYYLYAANHTDYLWWLTGSAKPQLFYSYGLGEWLSNTIPPILNQEAINTLLEEIKTEVQEQGVTVEIDLPNRMAVFTSEQDVEGDHLVVRIMAPFNYSTGFGYLCQAKFEIDMSYIELSINDSEFVGISSYDIWTELGERLPTGVITEFIFHTMESGILWQTITYNDGTSEGPVRDVFP